VLVPAATPVATPVLALIVALAVLLLVQVPPLAALLSAVVAPGHTLSVPTIDPSAVFTVTELIL
jgi:hypothetical protein